jgi:beta-RFAP synthase
VIFEGLVTTLDQDGGVHVAAMGPEFSPCAKGNSSAELIIKPYQTSRTFANLHRTGQCVFHLTDDVELIAAAAIGQVVETPRHRPAPQIAGAILLDACRWYALQVESEDLQAARAVFKCRVVAEGTQRDFLGFNRARHAVIEAAILATRVAFLDPATIDEDLARWRPLVEKTGGDVEQRAFEMLCAFIRRSPRKAPRAASDSIGRREVVVRAPARLHFGLFSFGPSDRQYGGIGVMIDEPALRLAIRPASSFSVMGPLASEVRQSVERCAAAWQLPELPACDVEVLSAPPRHAGLGSGTQLACAVAAGLAAWRGQPAPTAEMLARWTGRAQRSAVGTYGFLLGGLVVEEGRLPAEPLSPLLHRRAFPASWRFVLARPILAGGLSGEDELRAFATLDPVTSAIRDALVTEVEEVLLPALAAGDCQAFGESVYRYGRLAGSCFAAVQGGPYNGPQLTQVVATLRELGIAGVGQSSWGPTVFGIVDSQETAERMADELTRRYSAIPLSIQIAAANNRGADVMWKDRPPESEV